MTDPRQYVQWLPFRTMVLGLLQGLALLSFIAQYFIEPDTTNMLCVGLVVLTSSLVFQYLWHTEAMTDNPLSSLALLGFTASSQYVALLTQTFSGTSFVQYLRAPELTFSVLAVAHIAVIAAHFVFRKFTPLNNASTFIGEKIYGPLNMHRIPTPLTLWLFSPLGLAAYLLGGGGMGDVSGKFIAAFTFMVWMPFLIPLFHEVVGPSYCSIKKQLPFIAGYGLLIVGISLIKNYRAMMFVGPLQLMFIFIIYKCRHRQLVSRRLLKGIGLVALVGALAMPSFSDLMVAMQMARAERATATPLEMFQETASAFLDKQRLEQYRSVGATTFIFDVYDERYLSNPMLNRLSETKFHDNMFFAGQFFGDEDKAALLSNQLGRIAGILPQNIIDFLDLKIDKNKYQFSNGDLYMNQLYGLQLGGYITGSIWADMYVLCGGWFPLSVVIMGVLVFVVMDAATRFGPGLFISPSALCATWYFYLYGIGGESIVAKVNQLTRGTLQSLLLYALATYTAYFLLKLFGTEAFVSVRPVRDGNAA